MGLIKQIKKYNLLSTDIRPRQCKVTEILINYNFRDLQSL